MNQLLWFVAILLVCSRATMAVPTCGQVVSDLAPCLGFLQGKDADPACCKGVKDMSNLVKSRADLVAICKCGKEALPNIKYDPNRIPLLPKACGVVNLTLPPIDQNTNCDKAGI